MEMMDAWNRQKNFQLIKLGMVSIYTVQSDSKKKNNVTSCCISFQSIMLSLSWTYLFRVAFNFIVCSSCNLYYVELNIRGSIFFVTLSYNITSPALQ